MILAQSQTLFRCHNITCTCVCVCVVLCCRIHMSVPVPVTHSEDRPSASHTRLPHAAPWESHPVPWRPWSCSALQFCPFKNVIQMDSYSTWPFDTTLFCNTHPSCLETRGLDGGPRGLRRTVHSPETSHSHISERSLNLPCWRVGSVSLRNRGTVVSFCQVLLWVISRICLFLFFKKHISLFQRLCSLCKI